MSLLHLPLLGIFPALTGPLFFYVIRTDNSSNILRHT